MAEHNTPDGHDWAKMPFGEFVRRTPVGLLITVVLALLGAGFSAGLYLAKRDVPERTTPPGDIIAKVVEQPDARTRARIEDFERKLSAAEKATAENEALRSKCADENSRLAKKLLSVEASRKELSARVESEKRTLSERLSAAEKAVAAANSRQCPAPVLDANFVNQQAAVGSVEVCLVKATEVISRRGANPKTVGGNEVQAFLNEDNATFFCTIACYGNGTMVVCNGPTKFASRGLTEQLCHELSRKQ